MLKNVKKSSFIIVLVISSVKYFQSGILHTRSPVKVPALLNFSKSVPSFVKTPVAAPAKLIFIAPVSVAISKINL